MPSLVSATSGSRKYNFWDILSENGISVDPSKIQQVMEWKAPTSASEIGSFLGLVGYYHCFILDFLKIAKPTTHLLEKDRKFS
jgi:hypothetical protein